MKHMSGSSAARSKIGRIKEGIGNRRGGAVEGSYKVKHAKSDTDFMADSELKPLSVKGTSTKSF